MNKITKIVVAAGIAGMLAMPLSACGIKADLDVSVADKTVDAQGQAYLTKAEVEQIGNYLELAPRLGIDDDTLTQVKSLFADLQPAGIENHPDLLTNDKLHGDSKLLTPGAPITAGQLAESGVIFDDDKLVFSGISIDQDGLTSLASNLAGDSSVDLSAVDLGSLSSLPVSIPNVQDVFDQLTYYELTANFDKAPVASNGTISGNTVTFTDKTATQYYVTFEEGVDKATEITPQLKNKSYTKAKTVSFNTPGIVEGFSINGAAAVPPTCIDPANSKIKTNTALLAKQGANTVAVKLVGGYTKTFTYNYDTKKPTASVKAGKSYKKGTKITVKDAQALKSVKLDGKSVKISGKKAVSSKIKKAGSHKIAATDKAGNKLTVKFKIKKK